MARIRSVKAEFWHDRKLARSCSRDARMLYVGLWNHADEWSRANGDPAVIKGQVFPYDDVDVPALLGELIAARRVLPYEVDGDPFLFLPNLAKHQRLDTAKVSSKFPEPPADIEKAASPQVTAVSENSDVPSGKIVAESENSAAPSALLYGTGNREQGTGTPTVPALRTDPDATVQQRADSIAKAYYAAMNGMCKFPSVLDIAKRAIKSGRYTDQSIYDATMRLAESGRPYTVDSLRVELDGLPARASPNRATQRITQGLSVVAELAQENR